MSLALVVGIMGDLEENDPEGFENLQTEFEAVNTLLSEHGLPNHAEPLSVEPWSAEMIGYSGLHYLRRLAAYVDSTIELPAPGDQESSSDAMLEAYFSDVTGETSGFLGSLFSKKKRFRREFDHLIVHSDAEGFYLPIEFPEVLFSSDDQAVPGGMVGSVPRLLRECERLARVLQIPDTITKDSEELWEAADSQGEGTALWERFGIESFSCVALREACNRSLATGAAIVFA